MGYGKLPKKKNAISYKNKCKIHNNNCFTFAIVENKKVLFINNALFVCKLTTHLHKSAVARDVSKVKSIL